MNPVASAPLSSSTTKAGSSVGDQADQHKLDIRSDDYAAYSDKKVASANKKITSISTPLNHYKEVKISEQVMRFYEGDDDGDSNDDNGSFSEGGEDAHKFMSHDHQLVNPALVTYQGVLPSDDRGGLIDVEVPSSKAGTTLPKDSQGDDSAKVSLPANDPEGFISSELLSPNSSSVLSSMPMISSSSSATLLRTNQPVVSNFSSSHIGEDETESSESSLAASTISAGESSKSLSQDGSGANMSTLASSLASRAVTGFQSSGSLHASSASSESASETTSAAIRLSRFLDELTATVSKAQLSTDGSNDLLINLRSDVLQGTSIHISSNATHIGVSFSTNNAESNSLLNSNLATLQSHLAALCPTQTIDIRTDFSASARPSSEGEQSFSDSGTDKKDRDFRDS